MLTQEGKTYEPSEDFEIGYTAEEFERLCKLELATASPHLLDGARRSHRQYIYIEETYL